MSVRRAHAFVEIGWMQTDGEVFGKFGTLGMAALCVEVAVWSAKMLILSYNGKAWENLCVAGKTRHCNFHVVELWCVCFTTVVRCILEMEK